MLRARAVASVDEFMLADDDAFRRFVEAACQDGTSMPAWCTVVERAGAVVGRVGFTLEPSAPDPRLLGTLPPEELHAFGLRWDGGPAIGRRLLAHALGSVGGAGPAHVDVRVNRRHQPRHREHVAVLLSMGRLFQEKAGFELDGTTIVGTAMPRRLRWADVGEVGAALSRPPGLGGADLGRQCAAHRPRWVALHRTGGWSGLSRRCRRRC